MVNAFVCKRPKAVETMSMWGEAGEWSWKSAIRASRKSRKWHFRPLMTRTVEIHAALAGIMIQKTSSRPTRLPKIKKRLNSGRKFTAWMERRGESINCSNVCKTTTWGAQKVRNKKKTRRRRLRVTKSLSKAFLTEFHQHSRFWLRKLKDDWFGVVSLVASTVAFQMKTSSSSSTRRECQRKSNLIKLIN